MEQPKAQIILLDYLHSDNKDDFTKRMIRQHPQYTEKQWGFLTDKLQRYTSLTDKTVVLITFPYSFHPVKEMVSHLTLKEMTERLWNEDYKKYGVSKKDLEQICMEWYRFEKQLQDFTKENEKSLENTKDKEYDNDLDH